MTLQQAKKNFKEFNNEFIQKNKNDKIMINTAYHQYLDALCKDGEITQKQYNNASNFIK